MNRSLPFAALHDDARVRKRRFDGTLIVHAGQAPRAREVKMRHDDAVDVEPGQAESFEFGIDARRACDLVPSFVFGGELVADSGVDEDVLAASLDEKTRERKTHTVVFIRRHERRPDLLGDNAERNPAVSNDHALRAAAPRHMNRSSLDTPFIIDVFGRRPGAPSAAVAPTDHVRADRILGDIDLSRKMTERSR